MVESSAAKFGTEGYQPNAVSADDYASALINQAQKRGGCGGRGSKSHNFKEAKNANKRRDAKREREATKYEE